MQKHPNLKRSLLIVGVVILVLLVAFFSSLPLLVRSHYLEALVRDSIREQMGYVPNFERLRLSFFPVPILHIENIELKPIEGNNQLPFIRAEKASFRPSLFSLIVGKPGLAHAAVKHADIHIDLPVSETEPAKTFSIQDVSIDLTNIQTNRPIRIKAKGKFLNNSDNIVIDGTVKTDFTNFKPREMTSKVKISIGPVELSRLGTWWGNELPVQVNQGDLSVAVHVTKEKDSPILNLEGNTAIKNLIYQQTGNSLTSAPGNYELHFKSNFDLDSGVFSLINTNLSTPFSNGPFGIEAKANLYHLNVEEIIIKSKSLRLEVLPQYVLPLQEALPLNLGFSGESQFDLYLKGEPELLLVNSRIDLTQNTLAYSKYFSKPVGVPLFIRSEMKLALGRGLRGDFSVEFEEASFKGSLVGIDLVSGEGELTILTNKFNIDQWQNYFPPLRQVELSGGVKVLTSAKGNFKEPNTLRVMNNITLDGVQVLAKSGAGVRGLSGSLDVGPLDSELKDFKLTIGNSQFLAQGKMFIQPELRWLVEVTAPFINVPLVVSDLRGLTEAIQMEDLNIDLSSLDNSMQQAFPREEVFDSFQTQLAFEKGQFIVPSMKFNAFGGSAIIRATHDTKTLSSVAEVELERLNLARMQNTEKPLFKGSLFSFLALRADGAFGADWLNGLKGQGSAAISNGELESIDILGSLGQVAQLAPLESVQTGTTRFNDIRMTFAVADQKVQTNDLFVLADDFEVNGKGDISFQGDMNLRLSVFLPPHVARKITTRVGENSKLGPIPILISGPIAAPSVKPDPMLMQTFVQSLLEQQFSDITERFFPKAPQQAQPTPKETVQTQNERTGQPASLEESLVQGGLGLLDQFLSKKETTS